jgi:hypothetical protein
MRPTRFSLSFPRQLLLLTVLFVCSLPLVTTRIYASDEVQYFAYLRSLWFDHDVSFENEYQHFYDSGVTHFDGFHETFLERQTETGRRITFATIGSALLWSPFYGVADAIVHVRRWAGGTVEADGYSLPYVAAVAYGSAIYGWLALVLSMLIVRRVLATPTDSVVPLAAACAIWIGTPLFFYMYIAPPMSHACSAFVVATFVLTWLHVRGRWSVTGLIALGALTALMVMVREQDGLLAIGPAIDWTLDAWHARGSERLAMLARTAAGAAAFGVTYLPQLAAYEVINGYPGPSRIVAHKMTWTSPHALGVVLSPEHGLFFWTPLLLISLAGLIWLAMRRANQRLGVCLLVMLVSQIYIAGAVESWTVAGAFGQRRFVGLSALFIMGLAVVLARVAVAAPRVVRVVAAAAVVVGVWWNLGLMAQFGAGLMDRQRLELGRNAYQTFVTIPARVPELAYRYLFARRSFYQSAPPREP